MQKEKEKKKNCFEVAIAPIYYWSCCNYIAIIIATSREKQECHLVCKPHKTTMQLVRVIQSISSEDINGNPLLDADKIKQMEALALYLELCSALKDMSRARKGEVIDSAIQLFDCLTFTWMISLSRRKLISVLSAVAYYHCAWTVPSRPSKSGAFIRVQAFWQVQACWGNPRELGIVCWEFMPTVIFLTNVPRNQSRCFRSGSSTLRLAASVPATLSFMSLNLSRKTLFRRSLKCAPTQSQQGWKSLTSWLMLCARYVWRPVHSGGPWMKHLRNREGKN